MVQEVKNEPELEDCLKRPHDAWKSYMGLEREQTSYLVFGHTGFIGGKIVSLLQDTDSKVILSSSRMENRESIECEIDKFKINRVIIAAGLTHGKGEGEGNIDFCEANRAQTIRANLIGTLNVADICHLRKIHCTVFATGCIYDYKAVPQDVSSIQGYSERDPPNYSSSFYSFTKLYAENIFKEYLTEGSPLLVLRVRMPISDDFHERSLITKLVKYKKVINVPNSVSILKDLLPLSLIMAEKHAVGIYNFTNSGTIKHDDVLQLYTEYINKSHEYEIITLSELKTILKSTRCNNKMNNSKLVKWCAEHGLQLPSAQVGLEETFYALTQLIT